MVKFAHLADCHLGGWKQPELQELNFKTFQEIIKMLIQEKPDFILIAGDLFDSAYPSIEILKQTFAEFKKLKDENIPVYLIAGSHDYSASGKTFLDVLEKAGFCKNIGKQESIDENQIKLIPHLHGPIAIYGYPGKKSSMEIEDLQKIYFDSIYPFTILMLHTTIEEVIQNINMNSIAKEKLPLANYYAMGHIHQVKHIEYRGSHYVYPGPTFPNNFQELADLQCGSFQMTQIDNGRLTTQNIKLPIKNIVYIKVEIQNALTATEKIIKEIDKHNLNEKILLLKLTGTLEQGKSGDINYHEIEEFAKKKNAYSYLRNISQLKIPEDSSDFQISPTENIDKMEREIQEEYTKINPNEFNKFLPQLINALSNERQEDEKSVTYEDRLISELKNILNLKNII